MSLECVCVCVAGFTAAALVCLIKSADDGRTGRHPEMKFEDEKNKRGSIREQKKKKKIGTLLKI